jgi:hypothetical protein
LATFLVPAPDLSFSGLTCHCSHDGSVIDPSLSREPSPQRYAGNPHLLPLITRTPSSGSCLWILSVPARRRPRPTSLAASHHAAHGAVPRMRPLNCLLTRI